MLIIHAERALCKKINKKLTLQAFLGILYTKSIEFW
ncbi:hypothetical protein SAMN05216490_2907 [Mucilaginibacter mallensis]|uniref:Uncharacterized protein n=1 Tax=Mucilaginibacter mallensis TaxID=652787 RepID=A0A1H1YZI1_MUCMA|nr:hypothetical protein SAMN05216490_2907 [Mucilaginibacter mallensis]